MDKTPFDTWARGRSIEACKQLAQGRQPFGGGASYANQQSYQNCGLEAARQIINEVFSQQEKPPISQELLLFFALQYGFTPGPAVLSNMPSGSFSKLGATNLYDWPRLLNAFGIAAFLHPATSETDEDRRRDLFAIIRRAVALRQGVIAGVWAARLWPENVARRNGLEPGQPEWHHAVLPMACQGDQVLVNDTGIRGHCGGNVIPATHFQASLDAQSPVLVTRDPIWR